MLRPAFIALGLAIGATAVLAQADPIAERRNTMKAVGAATREGAAMAKGEAPFEAAKAQAIFKTYGEAALKMPSLYPESSKTGGETTAAPKIWEDQAGFRAAFAKFEEDSRKGSGVTDLAGFRTAFGEATKNCGSCHESFRIKK
jgi:cytochrome c556